MQPANIMREIQYNFDWAGYIEEHFTPKKSGNGEYRINCFSCGDTKYKLYVNPDKGMFNCFKCGFRTGVYDVFDFVAQTEGISKYKAQIRLAREYQRTTPTDLYDSVYNSLYGEDEEPFPYEIRAISGLPTAAKKLALPATGPAWDYLLGRGFTIDDVLDLSVHAVGSGDSPIFDADGKRRGNLEDRVIFPVYGGDRDLVSWQARTIDPNYAFNDKYMACPGSDLAKTLYPYVEPYADHVVLVEGILDAVAVRRVGEPVSAYAVFGKKLSEEQMLLLQSWGVKEVTLFFDKKDAKKEMIKIVEELKMKFSKIYVLNMEDWPRTQDAGDCLKLENGTELIASVLQNKVDVYSLQYERWKMTF